MVLKQALDEFLFHCKIEKNLNEKTLKAYSTDLEQFTKFIKSLGITDINNISKNEIKKYLLNISDFAPKTTRRKIASTKAFLNYHEFEENIPLNPYRKVKASIKLPKQLPTVMTLSQVEAIFSFVYNKKNIIENKSSWAYKEVIRDIAVLELLFASGIRVSELCNLKQNDFNSDSSLITVNGKGSKQRIIPITNESVLKAIHEYFDQFEADIDTYFFVNRLKRPLSPQSVRLMVKQYSKKVNISQNITPHIFRHSFATLLLEQDVDIRYIQNLLGHSSINTTQIYTHVTNKKKAEILTLKHPRNSLSIENTSS